MQSLARWVWFSSSLPARVARASLLPPAAGVGAAMRVRARGARQRRLALPSVAVGNLTVGGTGKTPIAAWIARYLASAGASPSVLLRGGRWGDEVLVHQRLNPDIPVMQGRDRAASAIDARNRGCDIAVLDDAFQLVRLAFDLNVLLVSAEQGLDLAVLPAGPARESWHAASRADLVVVTRKTVSAEQAGDVVSRITERLPHIPMAIATMEIGGFAPLRGGAAVDPSAVAALTVAASAGVADPDSFAGQLARLGAHVQTIAWPDHHAYTRRDVRRIGRLAASADRVVITEKDAIKLRALWPVTEREPWVARLDVRWDAGGNRVASLLDSVLQSRTLHLH